MSSEGRFDNGGVFYIPKCGRVVETPKAKQLGSFIDARVSPYEVVEDLRKYEGLLPETSHWNLEPGKTYYVVRNSSIIKFSIPENIKDIKSVNLVLVHNDSPTFKIKPNSEIYSNGFTKLNVEPYGGMIDYSWFDRPLGIAGRVALNTRDGITMRDISINKDILTIPSQAIHINNQVNKGIEFNRQKDLLPILGQGELKVEDIIKEYNDYIKEDIIDYDLSLYVREPSKIIGANKEFLQAPRLDDLGSLFPANEAFEDAHNDGAINVLCVLNNEEIGSLTNQGADSTFVSDVLHRIGKELNIGIRRLLRQGIAISADNAHALHPNAPEKADPTNKVEINKGVAIKHHTNYATDSLSSAVFKRICMNADVPYQDYAHRSDMRCGATLGPIAQSHIPCDIVDIGVPQWGMHSAVETCGVDDIEYMYQALKEYYESIITRPNYYDIDIKRK